METNKPKKRERIQFFIADTKMKKNDFEVFYIEDSEKAILGYEICVEENTKYVYYLVPLENNKVFCFICIDKDNNLDSFLDELTDVEYKYKKQTWPLFFTFVGNYLQKNIYSPFLVPFEINGNKFHCVGKILQGITEEDYFSEYVIRSAFEIITTTMDALYELNTVEMSTWTTVKMYGEQIIGETVKIYRYQNIADTLLRLLGM